MRASAAAECVRRAAAAVLLVAAALVAARAQLRVQPVAEYPNDAALRLMQRKLTTVGTFMQTTAHPDDEDNVLLAMLGHGRGMRTVLVSATRGEGGQNEIGPELFDALSVLRTEELLAAHRFDGAEQRFTRALDFGYSFSTDETYEKWGRDEIVGDYVRHIRATRPHVVAGFVCDGDGGGQAHQASTVLTFEAVRAAADPARYPEQIREGLRPWRVLRLFCTKDFRKQETGANLLTIDGGEFDPVIGLTYAELGTEARSMHKCQGTSQLLPLPRERFTRVYKLLEWGEPPALPLKTMYDGIDTSIAGLAKLAPADRWIADALGDVSAAAEDGNLTLGLRLVRDLRSRLARLAPGGDGHYEIDFRLAQKARQFEEALVLRRRVRVQALADDGVVTAGQPVKITAVVSEGAKPFVEVRGVRLSGFDASSLACAEPQRPGEPPACVIDTRIAATLPTSIYWRPRSDVARYDFDAGVPFGVPFAPSPFRAAFDLVVDGEAVTIDRPVEHRYSDILAGEKRMELQVVPRFGVELSPSIAVVPMAAQGTRVTQRAVRVSVTNSTEGPASGTVRLRVPKGFVVTPVEAPVRFAREDEVVTVVFTIQPPSAVRAGEYAIDATFASADDKLEWREGYQVVEYPHIRRRQIIRPAAARLKAIDVQIAPGLRIGYVMGVGDQVPPAIEQLGAAVTLIGPDELSGGDLSKYHVIVTGVRAYERRADLRANNHRLIAYAERGGTVLVQYNKFEFNEAQYGPYPAKVGAGRVTDENAPVEILVPAHPVFTTPNRIDADTWKGWVQERGLYFLGDRDERYVDLVRLIDPFPLNAGPKTGALVEARVGKGRWIYIGLGLWRQLPAGTDGAYELLANLLSLGRTR